MDSQVVAFETESIGLHDSKAQSKAGPFEIDSGKLIMPRRSWANP